MNILTKTNWIFLATITLVALIIACEETTETYEQFTEDGETIYIGAPDTVLVAPGIGKIQFSVVINADPKITKGVVRTKDMTITHEFEVVRQNAGKDTVRFDIELDEGDYNFDIFLQDSAGNASVSREVPAVVYADNYVSSLIARQIDNVKAFAERALIEWSDVSNNIVNTTITYEDAAGVIQTVTVANNETETELPSYKLGGDINIVSSFKPTDNAIDTFDSNPVTAQLPATFILDTSLITALKLPFDASEGCFGSSYAVLTDGATGAFWHSCNAETDTSDQYPFVMSFDLGVTVPLSSFKLDERSSCCGGRSPAAYQIWGTNELGEDTPDIDDGTLAEWEADATTKGWVKILDVSGNVDPTFEVDFPENIEAYRYIRFVAISAIDDGPLANFDEFTFSPRPE